MATLRFTAAERPALLARAVKDHGTENKLGRPLHALATALLEGTPEEFDRVLVEDFRELALEAAGLAPEETDG